MICTEDDEFIRDKVRWIATLSNGVVVYEDDGRPGIEPSSAWIRLRKYCKDNDVKIVGMKLQFRTNIVELPQNAPGYFFVKSAFGVWGEVSHDAYVVGTLNENNTINTVKYKIPELIVIDQDVRVADFESPCLIV